MFDFKIVETKGRFVLVEVSDETNAIRFEAFKGDSCWKPTKNGLEQLNNKIENKTILRRLLTAFKLWNN